MRRGTVVLAAAVVAGLPGCGGEVSLPGAPQAAAGPVERTVEASRVASPGGPLLVEWLLPGEDRPLDLVPSPGVVRVWRATVPAGRIVAVRTFLGVDARTNAEADLALLDESYPIMVRSDHLAACDSYDAWRRQAVGFQARDGQVLTVRLRAWTTDGRNSKIEAGVVLEYGE